MNFQFTTDLLSKYQTGSYFYKRIIHGVGIWTVGIIFVFWLTDAFRSSLLERNGIRPLLTHAFSLISGIAH